MRIIFDPQIFTLQKYGGISRYFFNLALNLSLSDGANSEIYCPRYSCQYLNRENWPAFSGGNDISNIPLWRYKKIMYLRSNLRSFEKKISQEKFDVVHHTYYWPLSNKLNSSACRITTIHDLVDEIIKPDKLKARLKFRSISQADHVICVSKFTRNLLLEYYDVNAEKVSVVHLAGPAIDKTVSPSRSFVKPYILYVGPRVGYKNFISLLEAYGSSDRLRRDFNLVCFGGGEFSSDETMRIHLLGLDDIQITQLSGGDALLQSFYKGASLFVYPSLYEGFGLPPLEAMALGVPVACGKVASIPEIAGEACEYFDPTSSESIREVMEQVLYSESRQIQLVSMGYERAGMFSWERCAHETLDVYRHII